MRSRISINGCVRPSVCWFVAPSHTSWISQRLCCLKSVRLVSRCSIFPATRKTFFDISLIGSIIAIIAERESFRMSKTSFRIWRPDSDRLSSSRNTWLTDRLSQLSGVQCNANCHVLFLSLTVCSANYEWCNNWQRGGLHCSSKKLWIET